MINYERKDTVNMTNEIRIRKPDYDLQAYLEYNKDVFKLEDIANIHAEVPGHNDEDHWHWIIELKDGRFVHTSAWCDYTGWDCRSGVESKVAATAEDAAMLAPEDEYGRTIQQNLLAQLHGEQPFGLEVRP